MKKGYFISLESGEGAGKTYQMPFLVESLRERGLTVFPTREPGGTLVGEQIRDILMNKKNIEMHPRAETLLFQAARVQTVENVIRPRLVSGEIVVSDRFFDSTIAYQGYGHRQDIQKIKSLIGYATDGLTPDLTVFLDVDVETGLARKKNLGGDEWNRLDAYEVDFHRRVREGYLEMIAQEPGRWIVIDANKPKDEVFYDLKKGIEGRLISQGIIEGSRSSKER